MKIKPNFSFMKVISFIFGFLFILASIGGFLSDDYFIAFFVLTIGIWILHPYYKKNQKFIGLFKLYFWFYMILTVVLFLGMSFNKASKYSFWISLTLLIIFYPITKTEIKNDFSTRIKNTKITNLFYARQRGINKESGIRTKKVDSLEIKKQELESFFIALHNKSKPQISNFSNGVILDDSNYNLFYSFINEVKKSLNILCSRIDEKLLVELLWFLRDKNIKVELIGKYRINKGYLNAFKKYCSELKVELLHRNKFHAKLIIRDNNYLILGSSNITKASMSDTGHFLDCNILTNQRETVDDAIDLFKSLYYNKDFTKNNKTSNFVYSRYGEKFLPLLIKPLIEQEKEEIRLLFSCNQIDKRVVNRIIDWNPQVSIKLYISDSWQKSGLSHDNLSSMKWLYDASLNDYKNIQVIPLRMNIHSKLYIFKSQKISMVSSQNLTVDSWQSLLELGILTNNEKDFKYLIESINSFKKSQLAKIEAGDLEETGTPESTFSGSQTEKSISIPWELPEADEEWRISKNRNLVYFNLVKNREKEQKDKSFEYQGKREESKEVIRNQLLQELKFLHLAKRQSYTGLRSSPTRYTLTGKLSKRTTFSNLEAELELYKKLLIVASNEQERKRFDDAIKWKEKEIEKYN